MTQAKRWSFITVPYGRQDSIYFRYRGPRKNWDVWVQDKVAVETWRTTLEDLVDWAKDRVETSFEDAVWDDGPIYLTGWRRANDDEKMKLAKHLQSLKDAVKERQEEKLEAARKVLREAGEL